MYAPPHVAFRPELAVFAARTDPHPCFDMDPLPFFIRDLPREFLRIFLSAQKFSEALKPSPDAKRRLSDLNKEIGDIIGFERQGAQLEGERTPSRSGFRQ